MKRKEGWLPTKNEAQYKIRAKQIAQLQKDLTECYPGEIMQIVKKIGTPYIITIGKYPCLASTFSIQQQFSSPHGFIFFYKIKD